MVFAAKNRNSHTEHRNLFGTVREGTVEKYDVKCNWLHNSRRRSSRYWGGMRRSWNLTWITVG